MCSIVVVTNFIYKNKMDKVQIVDMSEIGEISEHVDDNPHWIYAAKKIREGLGDIGFIYLKNHGIDTSLISKAFTEMQKLFDLPKDVKLKYKKQPLNGDFTAWCGYSEPGEEFLHPSSLKELRETFDILHGIGVYPDLELPDFNLAFSEMYKACNDLAKKVIILFAISLNLDDPKFFLNCCTHIDDMELPRSGNMRALHYPPIPIDMDVQPGTVRLGEHSDYALLTFLFQDMIGGLEVQTVDSRWIAAAPIPDTILVNTGDLLEFWTGGIFLATKHRVIIPENPRQKYASRYSIAYFLAPNVDTRVSSLKIGKTDSEEKRLTTSSHQNYGEMKTVTSMDYIIERLAKSYEKK